MVHGVIDLVPDILVGLVGEDGSEEWFDTVQVEGIGNNGRTKA